MIDSQREAYTPIIYTYLKQYQENPRSRVFAPLAEAYRKAGLIDEAIEIAREGVAVHPQFLGGKVALARALFDKKRYEEVLDLLNPVTRDAPDNLVAQRLVAESALMTGRITESLNAHKMLLYHMPQEAELARIVFELESQAYERGQMQVERPAKTQQERLETLQSLLKNVEKYRRSQKT